MLPIFGGLPHAWRNGEWIHDDDRNLVFARNFHTFDNPPPGKVLRSVSCPERQLIVPRGNEPTPFKRAEHVDNDTSNVMSFDQAVRTALLRTDRALVTPLRSDGFHGAQPKIE